MKSTEAGGFVPNSAGVSDGHYFLSLPIVHYTDVVVLLFDGCIRSTRGGNTDERGGIIKVPCTTKTKAGTDKGAGFPGIFI